MNSEKSFGIFCSKNFRRWKSLLLQALLFSSFFMFLELFFRVTQNLEFDWRFIYTILFSFPYGFFFAGVVSFFSGKINCILSTVIASLTSVWFAVQICYSSVFMSFMDVTKVTMAADVAQGFGENIKAAFFSNLLEIIALILITAVFSLTTFIYLRPDKKKPLLCTAAIVVCIILHFICRGTLLLGGSGQYSPAKIYTQYPRITDNTVHNFGVMTTLRLELCDIVFGNVSDDSDFNSINPDILTPDTEDETEDSSTDNLDDPSLEPENSMNVLDIDFDSLMKNEEISELNEYVSSLSGSYKNQYTGKFEGYNLIMICAESFTGRMISEELTPMLYKMSNGGFVFNNYYGMFKSITTNGEYAFCTGLIPNTVGKTDDLKKNSTFLLSADKYLPYCMGNVFNSFGASTFAYHSNSKSYYKRELTHPNMGYDVCRFLDAGIIDGIISADYKLNLSTGRRVPNSDEETAQKTVNDYLSDRDENGNVKQFVAYYMTYSGHHPYYSIYDTQYTHNPMTHENRDKVNSLNYSEVVKSYIAANLELEYMLTELYNSVKEAGCLDKTVFVLTNDHYPYGLYSYQFNELAGENVETNFGIYENTFICYNEGMSEPVVVDTPCCTVDIIPTLLNLFGAEYDSRLLAGTDILDEKSFHIAMLYNQCFITDKIKYNTKNGKITYLVDKESVTEEYVNACIDYVKNKFQISLQIINSDYYRIVYDSLEVKQ